MPSGHGRGNKQTYKQEDGHKSRKASRQADYKHEGKHAYNKCMQMSMIKLRQVDRGGSTNRQTYRQTGT